MGGFCGWIGFDGDEAGGRSVLERMVAASGVGTTSGAKPDLVIHPRSAATIVPQGAPVGLHRSGDHVSMVHGQVAFDDPVLEARADSHGAAAAILTGYLDRGLGVLERLRGGFALAIVRQDGSEGLLAVDRLAGRYPLSYKIVDEGLVFATRGRAIHSHPRGRSPVDPQGIYNYLFFNVVPGPTTIRTGVQRLMPGSYLSFGHGRATVGRYWEADYTEDDSSSVDELVAEFHEILRLAVRRDAAGAEVGCFLSGGTDSSTVAGVLGEVTGRKAETFSIGFDAQGFDEMEFARTTSAHFDTAQHEYYVTPDDVVQLIPRIAEAYSDPFGNASAVPTYHCARVARDSGVQRMLAGDGGDELFAGNERYVTQQILGLYDKLPRVLRRGAIEPMVFSIPGGEGIPPVRKARSYIRQAGTPMPRRMQRYNHLERIGAAEILDPDFLSGVDTQRPLELLADIYRSAKAGNMINRMLALDLRITLADNDLPKVSRMCELAGVEVAYPLLSDEMVGFSFRVPARLKVKRLKLRWFMKHALRDFLPRTVLTKKKHGFGLPFGPWMRDHEPLREIALDSLRGIRARGIVRPEFIDQLTALHQTAHAEYYGVMIWALMMLEQWFRANGDS